MHLPKLHHLQPSGTAHTERFPVGFTLVEMLAVLAIIAVMLAIGIPLASGSFSANKITRNVYSLTGALEQARAYATANNTYTWVGIFEENADQPGTPGTGRVILSVVASRDGTKIYSDTIPDPQALDNTRLSQVGPLVTLDDCHLDTLSAADVKRPSVPAAAYQAADTSFTLRDSTTNHATFTFPLSQTAASYTFVKIIQFSPLGDATKIADSPTPWMEFGLRPTHGPLTDTISHNVAAVQVAGIGGQTKIYRP